MKIVAVDREGVEHVVEGRVGWTVMEGIRDAGLPLAAECGGACACATCHCYVDAAWFARLPPQSDWERGMLDMAVDVADNSRLTCQIICRAELDGIRVTLAPEG
jgi:ferredoxin, 2Fe-2S